MSDHLSQVPGHPPAEGADGGLSRPDRSEALLKASSRIATWGVIGGFSPIIAFSLGAPISLSLSVSLLAAGLFVGGVGATAASVLTYVRCPSDASLLRAGAVLGAPLGVALASIGAATLLGWEFLSAEAGLAVSALGVVVTVLLVAAFLRHGAEDEPDDGAASHVG